MGCLKCRISVLSIFLVIFLNIFKMIDAGRSIEFDLIHNLTSSEYYDVNARPVRDGNDAVDVTIDIALQKVITLDQPTQVLSSNIFLRLYWKDVALTWNPVDHDNITSVRVFAARIWRPDITLYNDVGTSRREAEKLFPAIVTYDGNVTYLSSALFDTSCELDMTYFPWDSQACDLEMGSWTYDSSRIKIYHARDSADLNSYIENGEYALDGVPVKLTTAIYQCCPSPYESVIYTIKLTRAPAFYVINLVLPCVFVTIVGLLVFALPPTCGEKIALTLTVLLSVVFFLLLVAERIPPQSTSIPLISKYFLAVFILLIFSSAITVAVLNIHYTGEACGRPPYIVRRLVLDWLATVVFLNVPLFDEGDQNKETKTFVPTEEETSLNGELHLGVSQDKNKKEETCSKAPTNNLLSNILAEFKKWNYPAEEAQPKRNEWIYVAMVLDRIFFVLFFATSFITTMSLLIR